MGSRDHSETCVVCFQSRGGLNDDKCACDDNTGRLCPRCRPEVCTCLQRGVQETSLPMDSVIEHARAIRAQGSNGPLDGVSAMAEKVVQLYAEIAALRAGIQRVLEADCNVKPPGGSCFEQHSIYCARGKAFAELTKLLVEASLCAE